MSHQEPLVSLIITTYQMPSHLERVLASVRQQTMASRMEVIVSDDGSTDNTEQVVRTFAERAPFPVRFVSHAHDGFRLARCRNAGATAATSPHLIFLDGDCLIPPDHVEQHLRCHRPGNVTNTYCVRIDEPTTERITLDAVESGSYRQLITWRQMLKLTHINCKAWLYTWLRHPTKPRLRGGNVGLTRADYLRVNGYDENFQGWGCEDDDMGYRLRAAGLRIEYILHRTRTFHLWHPPAATKRAKHRDGVNYHYLHRQIRLTKCIRGVAERAPQDLAVRVVGQAEQPAAVNRFLAGQFPRQLRSDQRADLELLFWPGRGRFQGPADCRVLVVLDERQAGRVPKQADVVLSPSGQLGLEGQLKLRLDDIDSLYTSLGWPAARPAANRAA